ncbi:MAG: carbon-nitrogen hydrolase family protein [Chloroflexota bacterium]|nr:carbon-nitrogen hydrolase family protein [Chloroflexota bacterium]
MSAKISDDKNVHRLRVAAVQMNANPAPTAERLHRAEQLVSESVQAGARLIVLPELFNAGYEYSEENHSRAEAFDGPTVAWMRDTAARFNIHLAGSLMLLEGRDVYNALLLFSPDGRFWRYDKVYPWGWERGYFRETRQKPKITIAETDLGDIGLLICWDSAHLGLWEQYAGKVDLILICSSPPDVGNPTFEFPNGDYVTYNDMGPLASLLKGGGKQVFGTIINQQAAWMGVPVVNTVGQGRISTKIPNGTITLLGYAFTAPWLFKYLPQASQMRMSCDMVHECKIVDANGEALAALDKEDGETFTLAEVRLPASKVMPHEPQPASPLSKVIYIFSDAILPALTKPVYRRGRNSRLKERSNK